MPALRPLSIVTVIALCQTAGCGPSSRRGDDTTPEAQVRTLDEHRALSIVSEVLAEESSPGAAGWPVDIGQTAPLDVDLRVGSSAFGIEWMSEQDRADLGETIPAPEPGGQLRIVPGTGEQATAQILILEHASYEFANEREHVQRGVSSAGDAEARLRQDVRDFLHYARGQGGM